MAGREVTLEDLSIKSYLLDYIKQYGLNDNEDAFIVKMQEFLNADAYVYYDLYRAYSSIKNVINGEHLSYISIFKDETIYKKAFNEIEKEVKKALGWFDDSDSMTDYFHTAFYFKLSFAKWDKDYKIIKGIK